MGVYLDYAATTPLDADVETHMRPWLFAQGNPSSVHRDGARMREALENAREQLAKVLGAKAKELVFTSGGTESNNQAIFAYCLGKNAHIITTQLEHSAVLAPCAALEALGQASVTRLAPDHNGVIHPDAVRQALRPETRLVSVQHVNNEVGTIQNIPAIAAICKQHGAALHVDAVQSLGVVPLNMDILGADMVSISAHKFYGPKGVGALWIRHGLEVAPFLLGGHQERGLRGGTHNAPGIIGMAHAAEIAMQRQEFETDRLAQLRDYFQTQLEAHGATINAKNATRSPKVLNITAPNTDGEALLMNLDMEGVSASSGSACAAGTLEPSHVLLAMGLDKASAKASVRFSFGRGTTLNDLEFAAAAFQRAVARSRLLE